VAPCGIGSKGKRRDAQTGRKQRATKHLLAALTFVAIVMQAIIAAEQCGISKRQQTAIIGISELIGPAVISTSPSRPFALWVRNHGGGAAKRARWKAEIWIVALSDPCKRIAIKRDIGRHRPAVNIGVGAKHAFTVGPYFKLPEVEVADSPQGTLFLLGRVKFMDIFGRRHAEPFCFWLADKYGEPGRAYFPCVKRCPNLGH
jgi:hypothetical protein